VQVSTQLIPPYSGYLPDYADPSSEKLKIILQFNDFLTPQYNIKLKLEIKGNGFTIVTKQLFNPPPIVLQPGIPTIISGVDLAPYLNSSNLDFIGINQAQYENRMALPEGFYSICVTAYDYYNPGKIQVSNQSCSNAWFTLSNPPFLNLPLCSKNITPQVPQNIVFQWTPVNIGSPNSATSTEYDFELWEVRPDSSVNPNQIVLSTTPIYSTTTNLTLINYGIAEPPLNLYMKYVWRVRARDLSGRDWFKNNGYSQICTFVYGNLSSILGNALNLTLNANGITHRMGHCTWNTQSIYTNYKLQVRKQGTQNWFDYNTSGNFEKVNNLEPNTDYEARVRGEGSALTGDWSNVASFRTLSEPVYGCGDQTFTPDAFQAQALPISKAVPGLIIQSGQFEVKASQITPNGPQGWYSGKGTAEVYGFPIAVKFNNIYIDDNNRHQQGIIEALTEGITAWTQQWDKEFAENNASYIPGKIDSIWVSGNQICVKIQGDDSCFTMPPNQNVVVVRDGEGNQYNVQTTPPPPKITGPFNYITYGNDNIDAKDSCIVHFEQSNNQQFGFDKKQYAAWINNYETIKLNNGKTYYVPYKSVGENASDKVKAEIKIIPFDANKLSFKTRGGQTCVHTSAGANSFEVTVPADAGCVYAYYDSRKIGKLNVVTLKQQNRKLVLVPVNNAALSVSNVQNELNKLFGQANVNWSVTTKSNFNFNLGNDGLEAADANLLSKYSTEMRALRDAYKSYDSLYDKEAYYIFVVNNFNDPAVKGYMVRGRGLGFVAANASVKHLAHELAHGAFGLEHSFPAIAKNTSNNLMDYKEQGVELSAMQWEEMHSPIIGILISWDDSEEDGSFQICNESVAELAHGVALTKLNDCKNNCSSQVCQKRTDLAKYINNVCSQALVKITNEERFEIINCIAGGYNTTISNLHYSEEEPILRLLRTIPPNQSNYSFAKSKLNSNNNALLKLLCKGIDGDNYNELISLVTNIYVGAEPFNGSSINVDEKIFKWNGSNGGINFTIDWDNQGLLSAVIHTNTSLGYKTINLKPHDYIGILSKVALPGIKTTIAGKYYSAIVPAIYLKWLYDKGESEAATKLAFNAGSILTLQGGVSLALQSTNILTKIFGILELTSGITSLGLDNTQIENAIVNKYGQSGQEFINNLKFCLNSYNLASGTGQLIKLTTSYFSLKSFWQNNKQQIKNENVLSTNQVDKFDNYLDESKITLNNKFVANSGLELRAYLNQIVNKPSGISYSGKMYRYIPSQFNDAKLIVQTSTSDMSNRFRTGLYLSETKSGNIIEVSSYGGTNNKTLYEFTQVQVNNILDLTNNNTIELLGTSISQMKLTGVQNSYEFTHEVAIWAKNNGYNGVKFFGTQGGSIPYVNFVIFEQSTVNSMIQGSINSIAW